MSMDIADSVKNQGLIGFVRLIDGGPEISLEFRKGEYSKAVKITLDGHEVTAYLSLVPVIKANASSPNMRLVLTEQGLTAPVSLSDPETDEALALAEKAAAEKAAAEKAAAEKAAAEKAARQKADEAERAEDARIAADLAKAEQLSFDKNAAAAAAAEVSPAIAGETKKSRFTK